MHRLGRRKKWEVIGRINMPSIQVEFGTRISTLVPTPAYQKSTAMFGCMSAFVSGVLLVLLVEALLIMFVVLRSLEKKKPRPPIGQASSVSVELPDDSLVFSLQGGVWIAALPSGDVKKMYTRRERALREKAAKENKIDADIGLKESKSKRDALKGYTQVLPVWRYARLQGRILHLTCRGVKESILLEGCEIKAVSGSVQPGRKWAKKYPLRVHNGSRHVFGGCYDCLLYLETGWEKEAWCEVLRAACSWEQDADRWYFNLKNEYKEYCNRVENQFPFLSEVGQVSLPRAFDEKVKIPKVPKGELTATTKKRLLWRKITRRNTKGGKFPELDDAKKSFADDAEDESSKGASFSSHASDAVIPRAGSVDLSGDESGKVKRISSKGSNPDSATDDPAGFIQIDSLERSLLCFNKLFARIFFDLYHSTNVVARIQAKLQKQLGKVSAPSYIGKINCTHLDLGKSPPLANNIRLLAMDSDGSWGIEADVEYYGGAILTIETRIDVRDSNAREKGVIEGIEQTLAGSATADLLSRGLENIKSDFGVDEGGSVSEQRNAGGTSTNTRPAEVKGTEDGSRRGWMQSPITSVKAAMSRYAERVSQVPLALTIRVVQCKGTLQIRIKPPPSDRVWFSFREMPTLELLPEPCIGDHKINSGPLGTLVVNQIKVLFRDAMVFPQCEDISYSWMISEAGNWIPREAIPLPFVPDHGQSDQSNLKERRENQLRREGSVDIIRIDASGVGPSQSFPGIPFEWSEKHFGSPPSPPRVKLASALSLPVTLSRKKPATELTRPLLEETEKENPDVENGEPESVIVRVLESPPALVNNLQVQTLSSSDSDTASLRSEEQGLVEELGLVEAQVPLRGSKRAKVYTFGKKVGNRLQEKRRSVLGKMRDRSGHGSDHPPG